MSGERGEGHPENTEKRGRNKNWTCPEIMTVVYTGLVTNEKMTTDKGSADRMNGFQSVFITVRYKSDKGSLQDSQSGRSSYQCMSISV